MATQQHSFSSGRQQSGDHRLLTSTATAAAVGNSTASQYTSQGSSGATGRPIRVNLTSHPGEYTAHIKRHQQQRKDLKIYHDGSLALLPASANKSKQRSPLFDWLKSKSEKDSDSHQDHEEQMEYADLSIGVGRDAQPRPKGKKQCINYFVVLRRVDTAPIGAMSTATTTTATTSDDCVDTVVLELCELVHRSKIVKRFDLDGCVVHGVTTTQRRWQRNKKSTQGFGRAIGGSGAVSLADQPDRLTIAIDLDPSRNRGERHVRLMAQSGPLMLLWLTAFRAASEDRNQPHVHSEEGNDKGGNDENSQQQAAPPMSLSCDATTSSTVEDYFELCPNLRFVFDELSFSILKANNSSNLPSNSSNQFLSAMLLTSSPSHLFGLGQQSRSQDLTRKDFRNWSEKEVMQWLSHIRTTNIHTNVRHHALGELFRVQHIDGSLLEYLAQKGGISQDEFGRYSNQLGGLESLYPPGETVELVAVKQVRDSINKMIVNNYRFDDSVSRVLNKFVRKGVEFNSLQDAVDEAQERISVDAIVEKMISVLTNEGREPLGPVFDEHGKYCVRMKFNLSEIAQNPLAFIVKKLASPIIADRVASYGMNHPSLSIGPLLLEWTTFAFVTIRRAKSSHIVFCTDMGPPYIEFFTEEDLRSWLAKIAEEIVRFNRDMEYAQLNITANASGATACNCQRFIGAIVECCGIFFELSPMVADYVDKIIKAKVLQQEGSLVFKFPVTENMRQQLYQVVGTQREIVFESHRYLDKFVHSLFDVCETFDASFPMEYDLLKAFDRTFCARHEAFKNRAENHRDFHLIELLEPLKDDHGNHNCAFDR